MAIALRDLPLWAGSWLIWRIFPSRAATKLAEFSHVEAGSGLDMLAAVEETDRREMRLRYFRHAQDELKHSRYFRERAHALAKNDRTEAVLADSGFILEQGINTKESLFQQLGELEFLAFVWVHEKRGAAHFHVYADLLRHDADISSMFDEVTKDERFHISYSRAELDRYREKEDRGGEVTWAVLKVIGRRAMQGWLRFSRALGHVMTNLWLSLAYFLVVMPAALFARLSEDRTPGFRKPEETLDPVSMA